ncbi:MAG TPA: FAD-dependent oxidoreductase, partial [Arenicellales bacterium]|nr:FAD-dependent oxidoreductase [Arenicellales bacterium]
MTRSPPVDYDVLISGAGLVGACCALALTPTGLRVCLLDKSPPSGQRRDPSMRVSAINRASENILRAVGAWHAIARARPAVFRRIEVWDAASTGTISFDAAEAGLSHLGYIVPNAVMV